MKPSQRSYNRRGVTLLEIVMVVAVISLLGTVTVRLLHAMLRQQTATTTQLALASSMSRLGEQLRKDVHNASEVDIYLSGTLVLETSKEEKVEWKRLEDRLIRAATIRGKPRQEHFDLLPELEHSFEKRSIEGTEFVVLKFEHRTASKSPDAATRDSRFATVANGGKVFAAVGRDLRYVEEPAP